MFNLTSWFRNSKSREIEKHQETIKKVEQHFTRITDVASVYAKTVEEMSENIDIFPDAVDACVEELEDPSVAEDFNSVHVYIRSVNEFRQVVAKRMRSRTENSLLIYKKKCAVMKEKIKDAEAMMKMEKKELKKLEKLKAKHPNLESTIKTAEEKVERAKEISEGSRRMLSRMMGGFERKKLLDLKRTTMGIICDEMWFHAHALELYTNAHKAIERCGGLVGWKPQYQYERGDVYEVLSDHKSRRSERESRRGSGQGRLSLSDL